MKTLQREEICELPEKHDQVLDRQPYGNPNREGCCVLLSSLHKQYQPATLVVFTSSSLETWYDIHFVTGDCATQSSLRDSNEDTEVHWKMLGSLHSSDGQGEPWMALHDRRLMIAWFMTSAAEVVIMHCCVIKTHREIHIGHFTSQCHLSHWVILWSRTQEDIPLRRWVGCSVQRGNEVCLFLPNRWPVSSRDSLHSALHLLCPATVVPSFLITGIYCSSGCLPVQISQQKACGDTEISGSGSQANFVRFLVIVTGTFFFF